MMNLHQLEFDGHPLLARDASALEYLALRRAMPMGVLPYAPDERTRFGIVVQCADREVEFVRFDTGHVEPEAIDEWLNVWRAVIASAIPGYLANGFPGVLMPMAYATEGDGPRDVGVCCLVAPADDPAPAEQTDPIDEALGRGASEMASAFLAAVGEAWMALFEKRLRLLKVDVRPRLRVGFVVFDFLCHDTDVFFVGRYPEESQDLLARLAAGGISELAMLPSVPLAIEHAQWAEATGLRE